jgi:hypothetical protein
VLALVAASLTAGCTDVLGNSGNDIQDSDGDGVIDSEDYAPRDPDVQEKSDVQGGGGSTSQPEPTATTASETPAKIRLETFNRDPLEGYRLIAHDVKIGSADKISVATKDGTHLANFTSATDRREIAAGDSDNPALAFAGTVVVSVHRNGSQTKIGEASAPMDPSGERFSSN